MEKNDKDTKGAATGAATVEKTLAGALSIPLQRAIRDWVQALAAYPAVAKALAKMDDNVAALAYDFLPSLGGAGISRIDACLGDSEWARLLKELMMEFVKISLDEIKKANDPDYEIREPEEIAAEAMKKVMEENELIMDKTGHFHLKDCLELKRIFKKNETYPVTWKEVLEQGKPAADCCFKRASTAFEKQKTDAASKRPNKKILSAADVIGMATQIDPDVVQKLNNWIGQVSDDEGKQIREYLIELDDIYELKGLMAIDEKHRLAWMTLLKEKNSRQLLLVFGHFLSEGAKSGFQAVRTFGTGVIAGANNVLDGAKKLDDSFAPLAAQLKAEADKPMDTRGPLARLFRRGN